MPTPSPSYLLVREILWISDETKAVGHLSKGVNHNRHQNDAHTVTSSDSDTWWHQTENGSYDEYTDPNETG